jgi:deoxyribonuclease V
MVERQGEIERVRFVAGLDISSPDKDGKAQGAIVILSFPHLEVVEVEVEEGRVNFPYIPGLLAFRELPLLLSTCLKVQQEPDLMLVDGQGIAHPRRFGIASHLGLFLNRPTIGCAKSCLCGWHKPVGEEEGDYAELVDKGELIGAALRTRRGAPPLYVSIGHKITLELALWWVRQCCKEHRLPEPLRLAHLAANHRLKEAPSFQRRLF